MSGCSRVEAGISGVLSLVIELSAPLGHPEQVLLKTFAGAQELLPRVGLEETSKRE